MEEVKVLLTNYQAEAAKGADLNALGLTSLNTMGASTYLLAGRTADAELMRVLVDLGADPPCSRGSPW